MPKKRKQHKSPFAHYKWWIICSTILMIGGYIIIYLYFRGDGFIHTGNDLEKSDWLTFLGGYISFCGTVLVSAVAILQNHHFAIKQQERDEAARKKALQPIFSITLGRINSQLLGTAEAINISNPGKNHMHKNVTIHIENVSQYPVLNVIIFHTYKYQLLKPGDKKSLQCAYEDSPDATSTNKSLIHICKETFEPTEEGIPSWFNICYEDIDGHNMVQSFELTEFDGTKYYTLSSIEEVCDDNRFANIC